MSFKGACLGFALLAGSQLAAADSWVMNNNGGGQIVLTDRVCSKSKSLREAYTHTPTYYMGGCWAIVDGKVHIAWENKERRVYNLNDFALDHVDPKNNVDIQNPKKTL